MKPSQRWIRADMDRYDPELPFLSRSRAESGGGVNRFHFCCCSTTNAHQRDPAASMYPHVLLAIRRMLDGTESPSLSPHK
jgi:hypothetical protein